MAAAQAEVVVAQDRCGRGQLGGRAARQREKPLPVPGELLQRDPALAFLPALVAQREQAAEVLVALPVFAHQRERSRAFHLQLGADQRTQPGLARGGVEARRSVDAACIGQAEHRVAGIGGGVGQVLRQRSGAQEAEGAPGMQLDVVSHRPPRSTTPRRPARGRPAREGRRRSPGRTSRATPAPRSTTPRPCARVQRSPPRARPAPLLR